MAAILTPTKTAFTLKVVTGTTESGTKKTASVSIGNLAPNSNPDINNLFSIGDKVAACLNNLVDKFVLTQTGEVADNS